MKGCDRKRRMWECACTILVVCMVLSACRNGDAFQVIEANSDGIAAATAAPSLSPSPSPKTKASPTPTPTIGSASAHTPAATLSPIRSVEQPSQLDTAPPFDSEAFLIDPYAAWDPATTSVFTSLPDGALVKLWLRWTDAAGTRGGQICYATAQQNRVQCEFELPGALPAQQMLLEVSYQPDDPDHPQEAGFAALFGAHGEALPCPPAYERADGGRYLMAQWSLPYPDEATAATHIESAWITALGGRVLSAQFDDGVLVATIDERDSGMDDDTFFAICAEQTLSYLQSRCKLPTYADPAMRLTDQSGQLRIEQGSDRFPAAQQPTAVYVTDGGARYHEKSCRYASGATKIPLALAPLRGYTPCKVCH